MNQKQCPVRWLADAMRIGLQAVGQDRVRAPRPDYICRHKLCAWWNEGIGACGMRGVAILSVADAGVPGHQHHTPVRPAVARSYLARE